MEEFIKEKIGVECKILGCRRSGPVMIVKLESLEIKKEIIKNKYKLKDERIFFG